MGIGGVLSQDSHLVSYFNEKLNEEKQWYSTYDKELYTVVQFFFVGSTIYYQRCLCFTLSIKLLDTLIPSVSWVKGMFHGLNSSMTKHFFGVENNVAYVLSCVAVILHFMSNKAVGFEWIKDERPIVPIFVLFLLIS